MLFDESGNRKLGLKQQIVMDIYGWLRLWTVTDSYNILAALFALHHTIPGSGDMSINYGLSHVNFEPYSEGKSWPNAPPLNMHCQSMIYMPQTTTTCNWPDHIIMLYTMYMVIYIKPDSNPRHTTKYPNILSLCHPTHC